jgi:hypothetical protein
MVLWDLPLECLHKVVQGVDVNFKDRFCDGLKSIEASRTNYDNYFWSVHIGSGSGSAILTFSTFAITKSKILKQSK